MKVKISMQVLTIFIMYDFVIVQCSMGTDEDMGAY